MWRRVTYRWTAGALVRAFRFLLAKLFLVVVVLLLLAVVLPPLPLAPVELSEEAVAALQKRTVYSS